MNTTKLGEDIIRSMWLSKTSAEPMRLLIVMAKPPTAMEIKNTLDDKYQFYPEGVRYFEPEKESPVVSSAGEGNTVMTVSRLFNPAAYGISEDHEQTDYKVLYGVFEKEESPDDPRDFSMTAWLASGGERKAEDLTIKQVKSDETIVYMLDTKLMEMVPKVSSSGIDPSVNEKMSQIVTTMEEIFDADTAMMLTRYLHRLYDAVRKYILTDEDSLVFYTILETNRFRRIERDVRKLLYAIDPEIIHTFWLMMQKHTDELGVTEKNGVVDRSIEIGTRALYSTMKVLLGFVSSLYKVK